MQNNHVKSLDPLKTSSPKPEIDRTPKTYTLGEQMVIGLKMASIGGAFFFLIWLFEKM